jgi:hypothetical protein
MVTEGMKNQGQLNQAEVLPHNLCTVYISALPNVEYH